VPITTNVVNSNPAHGEMYSIKHYVIKFVSDLQQVGGFLWVLWFPPPIWLTALINLKYYWKWRYTHITPFFHVHILNSLLSSTYVLILGRSQNIHLYRNVRYCAPVEQLDLRYRLTDGPVTQFKKNLKIPKGLSESVNRRRTDNTMTKR
jgi:hypothetical protein